MSAPNLPDAKALRDQLSTRAPTLWAELTVLVGEWVGPVLARLDAEELPRTPKTFNDPIWGTIELFPSEVLLLDSPLLQRLQGVLQLGMVYQVYHSAGHDRLEHTRGVVEAAERIMQALERNARRRRQYGRHEDNDLPLPSDEDRVSIRLAALLHDVGHGPFSHATENLIGERLQSDFIAVEDILRTAFPDVTKIAVGERFAAVVGLCEPMRRVFEHPRFGAVLMPARLAPLVVARVLGSGAGLVAPYLSGVISGPLDADKLDYMARDSYHAGLPVALDTNRLINKLEVVAVTPETVSIPTLRRRAEAAKGQRYYDVGISVAGLGAYEQMVVGRVILYDRLYYHHKVRAAEAMVRKLIEVSEEERGRPFALRELFFGASDDGMVDLIGGRLMTDGFGGGGDRARALARAIRDRDLYHRTFAVAKRFIGGLDGLPEKERDDARVYRWNVLLKDLSDPAAARQIEEQIVAKARECLGVLTDLGIGPGELRLEHVVLDVAFNKVVVRGSDILTRTEDGHLGTPNLFFDPERWSNAYKEQKQCGFVFAPRRLVPLVALAARIVFYDRFRLTMNRDADRVAKTSQLPITGWIDRLAAAGVCSPECKEALTAQRPQFVPVRADEIRLPEAWRRENPKLAEELAQGFTDCLPDGVLSDVHAGVLDTINDLAVCLTTLEESGQLVSADKLDERREFQPLIRDGLRNRQVPVDEAAELNGGQVDLRVRGRLIIENKVLPGKTADPFGRGPHFAWQARRYAMAMCANVTFQVVAYQPTNEAAVVKLSHRIRVVRPANSPPGFAQVRVVVPFGHGLPHDAKAAPTQLPPTASGGS